MAELINVFLDSNSIFGDPIFKTPFGRLLLELSENKKINIFLSRVVYDEGANNFKKEIQANIESYERVQKKLNKLLIKPPNLSNLNENEFINDYTRFYKRCFQDSVFQLIEYEDGYLKELVRRSIRRIRPFGENRQEFRDAVIWISYTNYIKRNKLSSNFFITNNKKDFWNSDKSDLHPDLRNEVDDLKIYSSISEFCSSEKSLLKIKGQEELAKWIENNPLDKDTISTLLLNQAWHPLKLEILESVDALNPTKYFQNDDYGYFKYNYSKDGASVDKVDIRQITNFVLVRCTLILNGVGIFYPREYRFQKDKKLINLLIDLSFNIDQKMQVTDLKIEEIKLNYAQQL